MKNKSILIKILIILFLLIGVVAFIFIKNKNESKIAKESKEIGVFEVQTASQVVELGLKFVPDKIKPTEITQASLYVKQINNSAKSIDGISLFFSIELDSKLSISESDIPNVFDSSLKLNGSGFPIILYNADRKFINLSLSMYRGTFNLTEGTVIYSFPLKIDSNGEYLIKLRAPDGSLYVPSITNANLEEVLMAIYPEANIVVETPQAQNTPPTITGTPATTVKENQAYLFTPTASDADGDTLTFSIENKPVWASFDTTNGKLSGTPTNTNIGDYSNIVIKVSDGKSITNLTAFQITVLPATSTVISTPTISTYLSTTYNSKITISGTKEAETGIRVNGQQVVAESGSTDWTYEISLSKLGNNKFDVQAFKGGTTSLVVSVEVLKHGVGDLRIDIGSSGDSAVDARDLAVFAGSYYKYKTATNTEILPTDPTGYRLSDMNQVAETGAIGDGVIDAKDISAFVKNFRKTYKYE